MNGSINHGSPTARYCGISEGSWSQSLFESTSSVLLCHALSYNFVASPRLRRPFNCPSLRSGSFLPRGCTVQQCPSPPSTPTFSSTGASIEVTALEAHVHGAFTLETRTALRSPGRVNHCATNHWPLGMPLQLHVYFTAEPQYDRAFSRSW